MEKIILTEKEKIVLRLCIDENYTAEDMINDPGIVITGANEIVEETGWTSEAVAGVLGSLEKKGLGHCEGAGKKHIFWPSDLGYTLIYQEIENNGGTNV